MNPTTVTTKGLKRGEVRPVRIPGTQDTQWQYSVFSQAKGFVAQGHRATEAKALEAMNLALNSKGN